MLSKLSSALSSLTGTPGPLPADHHAPARVQSYAALAERLGAADVPVSLADCSTCADPCDDDNKGTSGGSGKIVDFGLPTFDGKSYEEYVHDKYGELGELPKGLEVDWDSELAGSAKGGQGRIVIVSTGKSDWERDHVDELGSLSHHLDKVISANASSSGDGKDKPSKTKNDAALPSYISRSAFPAPSQPLSHPIAPPPSLYSSSLITQSDDPDDQTVLVFPDWKVVHEVENSRAGAQGLWDGALSGELGRAGKVLGDSERDGVGRRRSWVLPYRAVILLCSHKRRDKRCHIGAPLLRSALHTCLAQHDITIDETGASLTHLSGQALESLTGSDAEREAEVGRRIEAIEGVHGGDGGDVAVLNINHLGGHRYASVMMILFPSGAYVSYGRVTPQEIPRVVEDTILQGKIVPGLLRNAVGVARPGAKDKGFLAW